MVHCDVKAENVFLDDHHDPGGPCPRAYLAALGLANDASVANTKCAGTPLDGLLPFDVLTAYRDPEHPEPHLITAAMHEPSDIWATGCLWHSMEWSRHP